MATRTILAALLALVTAGCGMSLPADEGAWTQTSLQAVEDMAGNVATSRLVLDQQQQGRLVGRMALVVAQAAEEGAGTVSRGYTGSQPPAARTDDFVRLSELLGQAEATVTQVRVAVAAGRTGDYAALETRLTHLTERLDAEAGPLRQAAP